MHSKVAHQGGYLQSVVTEIHRETLQHPHRVTSDGKHFRLVPKKSLPSHFGRKHPSQSNKQSTGLQQIGLHMVINTQKCTLLYLPCARIVAAFPPEPNRSSWCIRLSWKESGISRPCCPLRGSLMNGGKILTSSAVDKLLIRINRNPPTMDSPDIRGSSGTYTFSPLLLETFGNAI